MEDHKQELQAFMDDWDIGAQLGKPEYSHVLCEESWQIVMEAIRNPPEPTEKLKRAFARLKDLDLL